MSVYPIGKNLKISMNNWKRHWKFRPSPMRNLFSASDNCLYISDQQLRDCSQNFEKVHSDFLS